MHAALLPVFSENLHFLFNISLTFKLLPVFRLCFDYEVYQYTIKWLHCKYDSLKNKKKLPESGARPWDSL
jgi:hypothetical protein